MGRFEEALRRPGLGAIAEIKRRSPSAGDLRPAADPAGSLPPTRPSARLRSRFSSTSGSAGTWDDLRAARAATDAPLLAKGFFSTAEDLRTAREAGADAVLLLLRDLDDEMTRRLSVEAAGLGLDTLVEAHDADELARAIALDAPVVGVNARDLTTFAIDRRAQLELVARVPSDRVVIAESGDRVPRPGRRSGAGGRRCDPRRLDPHARARPRCQAGELLSRPLVKVCGLTRDEDVAGGGRGGADLLGFVLAREPACRETRALPCRRQTLAVAVWVGEAGASEADLDQVHTVEEGKVRGREATLFRKGAPVARVLDLPWGETIPLTGSAPRRRRAASSSPAASAPRTWPPRSRQSDRGPSMPLRRSSVPRHQGPRSRPRVRRGGARVTAVGDFRRVRRAVRPGDADPGARRAGRRVGAAKDDPAFRAELDELGRTYVGRPSPVTRVDRFAPGKRLYLKREDLNHTGAHKINNALGQVVLARRLGKRRIIAETGAGQHGVATATACARFGLECVVFMGSEDMRRQAPNVERMQLLGADRRAGGDGHEDAEGGDERGDPRLDHERRDHALRDRVVRRPRPLPRARRASSSR